MGISNFHNKNAQNIYVIDYEDDEFGWQECQERIGEDIKIMDSTFNIDDDIDSVEELSCYPTLSIGYWEFELIYLGLCFVLRVNLFIRSGYYSAANLDYEYNWFNKNDVYGYLENFSEVVSELEEELAHYDINRGIFIIHKERLELKLKSLEINSINHIEEVLKQIATPYGVATKFSNGETIYQKIGD